MGITTKLSDVKTLPIDFQEVKVKIDVENISNEGEDHLSKLSNGSIVKLFKTFPFSFMLNEIRIYSNSPSSSPHLLGICDTWISNMSSSPSSQSSNIPHQPRIPNTNDLGFDDNMVLQLWQGGLWNQCLLRNPWTILQVSNFQHFDE